jgi:hypothetical protein
VESISGLLSLEQKDEISAFANQYLKSKMETDKN